MTPYKTKTGLQIGLLYEPKPYIECDKDMLLIQEALLTKTKSYSDIILFLKIMFFSVCLSSYFIFK